MSAFDFAPNAPEEAVGVDHERATFGARDAEEAAAAQLLRSKIEANAPKDSDLSEMTCLRYLRANNGDIEKALKQLAGSLEWREAFQPASPCPLCVKNALAHSLRLVGFDARGRAVIYSCCGTAYDRWTPEANLRCLTYTMEQCAAMLDRRGINHQWVIIADFLGFNLWDADPRTGVLVARSLAHYPERLACMMLLDSPLLFRGTWRAVKPILNDVTRSKIRFTSSAAFPSLAAELGLGEEVTTFLEREMRDNRCALGSGEVSMYWKTTQDGFDKRATSSLLADKDFKFKLDGVEDAIAAAEGK